MANLNKLICPVSTERVDENRVRFTAFMVVLITAAYLFTNLVLLPAFLVLDFYIRAFTRSRYSPLSFLADRLVRLLGLKPVWIDKAPKMFAARVGLVFSVLMTAAGLLSLPALASVTASVLVIFAFLECGVNFCAGCWVYTYIVIPLVRK